MLSPLYITLQDDAANKSYNLAVAALASLPNDVIKHARQKLHELESILHHPAVGIFDIT